ncbi:hypothetical protein [uncultured Methanobrevibacter sp.]|uniref:hypothetical protein n=1 Tax=uncultured Methanobrevibacter sp. TaxID=253161 RepID=UPI0025CE78A1|nr:hypothetical protein [uncultured Methanobrevibacter sp.]
MDRFYVEGGKIIYRYTGRSLSLNEACNLLNRLSIESERSQNDLIKSIELKAVNRHLRMENRFLTVKLHEIAYRAMVDASPILEEISELCLNPKKTSDYIHKFEKENFELKKKLKEQGGYNGDLL